MVQARQQIGQEQLVFPRHPMRRFRGNHHHGKGDLSLGQDTHAAAVRNGCRGRRRGGSSCRGTVRRRRRRVVVVIVIVVAAVGGPVAGKGRVRQGRWFGEWGSGWLIR